VIDRQRMCAIGRGFHPNRGRTLALWFVHGPRQKACGIGVPSSFVIDFEERPRVCDGRRPKGGGSRAGARSVPGHPEDEQNQTD